MSGTLPAIDLGDVAQGLGGFVLQGEDPGDANGFAIASAGDINGDGFADLIVSSRYADGPGNRKDAAGAAYVVFGHAGDFGAAIDLGQVARGRGGFVIEGRDARDVAGTSVASAGDINGDGFDDLIVGADFANGAGNATMSAGEAYVVFGRADGFGAKVKLAQVAHGHGGFVLYGEDPSDYGGFAVTSAGDLNNDGINDFAVAAKAADAAGNAKPEAGDTYVVFGRTDGFGAHLDLARIARGRGGFVIDGEDAGDRAGRAIAAAGDVNGDHIGDLIVGAYRADTGGHDNSGAAYVVFGRADGFAARVDLAAVAQGLGGFIIEGEDVRDNAGRSVAAAGDLNGDGFADLLVSAEAADGVGDTEPRAGTVYVVFGGDGLAAGIRLTEVAQGRGGFVLLGEDAGDVAGYSVTAAGDFDGNGFGDLLIGAPGADGAGNGKPDSGDIYVVLGQAAGFDGAIDLAQIARGEGGFVIHGEDSGDHAGFSVAAAGDLNGDGFADLAVGARDADGPDNAKDGAGAGYVIFGHAFPEALAGDGSTAADFQVVA